MSLLLNIGCGKFKREGWVNIDIDPTVNPDRVADGVDNLPFFDDTADEIFAGHVLEHVIDDLCALRYWRRLLKPGGKIVVVVPDVWKVWSRLPRNMALLRDVLGYKYQGGETVNPLTHRRIYSEAMLVDLARRAGFENAVAINVKTYPGLVSNIWWQCGFEATKETEETIKGPFDYIAEGLQEVSWDIYCKSGEVRNAESVDTWA